MHEFSECVKIDVDMPDHFDNSVRSCPVTRRRLRDCSGKKIGIKYIICRTYSSKKGTLFKLVFLKMLRMMVYLNTW